MSWKRVVGLDFVDTLIHILATFFLAIAMVELTNLDELGFGVFALSTIILGIRRQRALAAAPPADERAQIPAEGQARINDFFEGRIVELEERLEFAERLLAAEREPSRLESGER